MVVPVFGNEAHGDDEEDAGLAELIPQYFELCRRDLESLRIALKARQFDEIRVLGHNLKGSGGAYGFPELSRLGARLESAGKSHDDTTARESVEQLSEFLNNRESSPV
jgi:HPt (histidine-containing phosphotransfer) domain-containing protein